MFSMVLVILFSVAISGGWLGSGLRVVIAVFIVADFGFAFALVAFFAGAFFAVGFLVVAFLATGFFFAVAMIYSPLAVVMANFFLAAYSRLFTVSVVFLFRLRSDTFHILHNHVSGFLYPNRTVYT